MKRLVDLEWTITELNKEEIQLAIHAEQYDREGLTTESNHVLEMSHEVWAKRKGLERELAELGQLEALIREIAREEIDKQLEAEREIHFFRG
ncbi:hypothetical protein LCGC14_0498690 [marine sediment metagenome]|uniref:Uncharacterized protein n=1 Tax=marine sediment metagenome TaxID=412755 RepID=A0A0F9S4L3_9ZZZZ